MAWVAVLLVVYLAVGLRNRQTAGSRHLFIVVITGLVLAVAYFHPPVPR